MNTCIVSLLYYSVNSNMHENQNKSIRTLVPMLPAILLKSVWLSLYLLQSACAVPLYQETAFLRESSQSIPMQKEHHKSFHQDIHPYGSHRRRYRCVAGFFSYIFVQSGVVALHCAAARRHGRHEPHDSASAFSAPGCAGLFGRRGMLVCVCAAVLSSASLCLRRSVLWPQAAKVSTR